MGEFFFALTCVNVSLVKGNHGRVFVYLFVGGGGGVQRKTIHQRRENEANMNKSCASNNYRRQHYHGD